MFLFSKFFFFFFFFFNDTATTEIYTLSLHDALPISIAPPWPASTSCGGTLSGAAPRRCDRDRKSTRLNSSHVENSYAVFCLKKKNEARGRRWRGVRNGRRRAAAEVPGGDGPGRRPAARRRWSDVFFLTVPRRPRSTLFPYPTLFRSPAAT